MYIFVYGSLRHRLHNNWLLDDDTYIGMYKTKEAYYMVGPISKAYPYCSKEQIFQATTPSQITGEVYDISPTTLRKLDALEGTSYVRQTIEIEDNILADMYLLENDTLIQELRSSGKFIAVPHGDWIKFIDSNESPACHQERQGH